MASDISPSMKYSHGHPIDTDANWKKYDGIFDEGEIILVKRENNTPLMKIGDGIHTYDKLEFYKLEIQDSYYTKSEVYNKNESDGKYRTISDSYTKTDVDGKLSTMSSNLYTKTEINTKLNDYRKVSESYTKTEVDNKVATKADKEKYDDAQINIGRLTNSKKGANSVALGKDVISSENCSYAEGLKTKSSVDRTYTDLIELYGITPSAMSSHAEGWETLASSTASHAEGYRSIASGSTSHAENEQTCAFGINSHAEGSLTTAYGINSHAEGSSTKRAYDEVTDHNFLDSDNIKSEWKNRLKNNDGHTFSIAYGENSHIEGIDCLSFGNHSHAEGSHTKASGSFSHAEGYYTVASADYSHAEGSRTTASGSFSHAEGFGGSSANKYSHSSGYYSTAILNEYAIGHFNNYTNNKNTSNVGQTSGNAFMIGNGSEINKLSNAFRVCYNGTVYATNASIQTGADYAEYFEWSDGNPDNEDRVGKFVTFDNDSPEKIRIANKDDEYILGIVSGMPSVIGNGDEDWKKRYILDDFGRYIPEEFEYEDEEGNKQTSVKWKENPDYDNTKEYVARSERAEWSAIGMVGVLSVYDDGTCQVNGYCKCSDDGIATKCDKGLDTYRVINRVNDNIIKIVLK